MKVSIGASYSEDSNAAGTNATQTALDNLRTKGGTFPQCVIVFASSQYDQQKVLDGVKSVCPQATIVGASTAGEITSDGPLPHHSVAVMMLDAPDIRFATGVGEHVAENARHAGAEAARIVKEQMPDLVAFLMTTDILAGNGAEIVRGVVDSLGTEFTTIAGGGAGDDFAFKKTYQYGNGTAYSGAVVGLGLSGPVKMGIGVKHGWIPVGIPKTVTRSEGAVLYELDGKPAIDLYKGYFGEDIINRELKGTVLAPLTIQYPLGMKVPGSDDMLLRAPFMVDPSGSITCAAEVPQGSQFQLMIGSQDDAIKLAKVAAQQAKDQLGGLKPEAIIIFNCIARSKLFGERAGEEIQIIQEAIGEDVPLIGFYTYSEHAPIGTDIQTFAKCIPETHNETVVICVLAGTNQS